MSTSTAAIAQAVADAGAGETLPSALAGGGAALHTLCRVEMSNGMVVVGRLLEMDPATLNLRVEEISSTACLHRAPAGKTTTTTAAAAAAAVAGGSGGRGGKNANVATTSGGQSATLSEKEANDSEEGDKAGGPATVGQKRQRAEARGGAAEAEAPASVVVVAAEADPLAMRCVSGVVIRGAHVRYVDFLSEESSGGRGLQEILHVASGVRPSA